MPFKQQKQQVTDHERRRLIELYVKEGMPLIATRGADAKLRLPESALLPDETWEAHIRRTNCNIGVTLKDTPFVDIDFDSEVAASLAPMFLPKTAHFSRPNKPPSHYFYKTDEAHKYAVFYDKESRGEDGHKAILEWRQSGGYTVVPPSVHANGDKLEWNTKNPKFTEVPHEELFQAVTLLAVATLLCLRWKAGWHNGSLHLAAGFAFMNIEEETTEHLMECVGKQLGMKDVDQKIKNVHTTYEKYRKGEAVAGWNRLTDSLGRDDVDTIRGWLAKAYGNREEGMKSLEQWCKDANETMAVMLVGGTSYILVEKEEPGLYYLSTEKSMEVQYRDQQITYYGQTPQGKPKLVRKNPFKHWLETSGRRNYPDGIYLAPPGRDPKKGAYNPWRGFRIPAVRGNCKLIQRHYKEVICAGNTKNYNYTMDWLADMIQNPGRPQETCLVLIGQQGCGKNMAVAPFEVMFGTFYQYHTDHEHLFGRFANLTQAIVVVADEVTWGGSPRDRAKLFSNIASANTPLRYELKGGDQLTAPNNTHWFILSNEGRWVIPADGHSRRFNVLHCSDQYVGDRKYFQNLADEIFNNGGTEAFLYYLQKRKIKSDLRTRLETEALNEQREHSLDAIKGFYLHVLQEGKLGLTRNEPLWQGPFKISANQLFAAFTNYVEKKINGYRHDTVTQHKLSRETARLLGVKRKIYFDKEQNKTVTGFEMPTLKQAKKMFEKSAGIKV